MTPKEKAEDLIDSFVRDGYDLVMSEEMAKRCALIAVDEILFSIQDLECENVNCNFWCGVKQEIKQL